jgi:hypothetical protein
LRCDRQDHCHAGAPVVHDSDVRLAMCFFVDPFVTDL